MKTKIVVLVNQFLNQTNYERFNLDYKKKSINIIFWSLTPMLNKKVFEEYYSKDYRKISYKNFIYLRSYREIFKNIKKLRKNTIFLNLAGKNFFIICLEFLLKFKGCIKIEASDNFFYLTEKKKYQDKYKDLNTLLNFGYIFTILKIFNYIYKKILVKFYNSIEIKPKFYFTHNDYLYQKLIHQKKKVLKYKLNQVIQAEKCYKRKSKNNYIVYVDQEFESSFEQKITKNKFNIINKEKYFNCLKLIFKNIEKKNKNKKIIIASHFRRSNKNLPNLNRKFIFDKTIDLIYNSKLIIAHNSTAINFAILFDKPIILLNFKVLDYIALINSKVTESFAEELSIQKIDIDLDYNYDLKKIKKLNFSKIRLARYDKYKSNYLFFKKNKNIGKSIWDCISENIDRIIH